jgi:hypothetical protein
MEDLIFFENFRKICGDNYCKKFSSGKCNFQHTFNDYFVKNMHSNKFYVDAFIIKETCKNVYKKNCNNNCCFKHIDTLLWWYYNLDFTEKIYVLNINIGFKNSNEIIDCLYKLIEKSKKYQEHFDDTINNLRLHYNPKFIDPNAYALEFFSKSENKIKDFQQHKNNIITHIQKNHKQFIHSIEELNKQSDKIVQQLNKERDEEFLQIQNAFNKLFEEIEIIVYESDNAYNQIQKEYNIELDKFTKHFNHLNHLSKILINLDDESNNIICEIENDYYDDHFELYNIFEKIKNMITVTYSYATNSLVVAEQFVKEYETGFDKIISEYNDKFEKYFEEQKQCKNHIMLEVCDYTQENNATCCICTSLIVEDSEYDISGSVSAIKDNDIVFCVECIQNLIKNANFKDISNNITTLPGIKCPLAQTKENHNHRFSLIALTIALAQATSKNSTQKNMTDMLNVLVPANAQYHCDKIQVNMRYAISKLEKDGVTSVSYLVQQIQTKILTDACPNCYRAYDLIGGCQSIQCRDEYNGGGCKWFFCNVCLEHTDKLVDSHTHVAECIRKNGLNGVNEYFLNSVDGKKWRMKQRCKRIRKYLDSQPREINYAGVLVVLYENDHDLRPYLKDEFKEYAINF